MLQSATAMEALVGYLREQRGVDFSGYKPTSLERRVRHAMTKAGSVTRPTRAASTTSSTRC
jgi:two-component system CheB/CheR fusion protein